MLGLGEDTAGEVVGAGITLELGVGEQCSPRLDGMGGWGLRSHVNVGCRQGGPGR